MRRWLLAFLCGNLGGHRVVSVGYTCERCGTSSATRAHWWFVR